MPGFINDDLTFTEDWREKALPKDLQSEPSLADFKSFGALAKAFVDTKRANGGMVKLPTDEAGKRAMLKEHFQLLLEADAAAQKKTADEAAEVARKEAEQQAETDRDRQREAARTKVKALLGGADGADFDKNMELARRAMRHERMPQIIKDIFATSVQADSFEKVSDVQILDVLGVDPAFAALAQAYGELLQDGHTEHGDGGGGGGGGDKDEQEPLQPEAPQLYNGLPDNHPHIVWFKRRGYKFEAGRYVGRETQT